MGPLTGIKVIELVGLGPTPFCGMMLSDMGAEVISIERPTKNPDLVRDDFVCMRGRRSLVLDLKTSSGVDVLLDLCETADIIYEGFRPGVMERLGIGPEQCMARNPALVYGRVTGWGQSGPLAFSAGHDINYISLSGALHAIGREGDNPLPPLNLVGDYGGGGLLLAFGLISALFESRQSGQGQVVDSSMLEGSSILMSVFHGIKAKGSFSEHRGTSVLDTGAPFYEVYETKAVTNEMPQFISIGPLEPQFYQLLLHKLEISDVEFQPQMDRAEWADRKRLLTELFKTKTREEWCDLLEGTDTCFAPVLSLSEAPQHPQNISRGNFIEVAGVTQPAPAPKFSRTEPAKPKPMPLVGADTNDILTELGYSAEKLRFLRSNGAVM